MAKKNDVSPERWDRATDLFELGFLNGQQISLDLGVSAQTVMREMKKRGAIKGSRTHETVADLEAFLDRKANREAHAKAIAEISATQRRAAGLAALKPMMDAILAADACGDLSKAENVIARTADAFGARISKKSCRR